MSTDYILGDDEKEVLKLKLQHDLRQPEQVKDFFNEWDFAKTHPDSYLVAPAVTSYHR
ncbi:MAG: hypothetical protein H7328_08395 [Bdellovibrio sp.]|nr:hypothetical protein [Bdellovibrio sp.]